MKSQKEIAIQFMLPCVEGVVQCHHFQFLYMF